MTSATEELRRMLDERGVEWWQSANTLGCVFTRWYSPLFGDEVCAMENGEEGLVLFDHFVTPEQAIAARSADMEKIKAAIEAAGGQGQHTRRKRSKKEQEGEGQCNT